MTDFHEPLDEAPKEEAKPNLPVAPVVTDNLLVAATQECGVTVNADQLAFLDKFMANVMHGHQSSLPMICKAEHCPFVGLCPLKQAKVPLPLGKQCHPPGTLILTSNRSWVAIEKLNEIDDKLITYCSKKSDQGQSNGFKVRGREFKLGARSYSQELVSIQAGVYSHECTFDHISIAKFNENALDKFIVYLMRKGNFFRIGKTKLIRQSKKSKMHSGIAARGRQEGADAMWILGVYSSNVDASLAEEYFSVSGQIPKACFVATKYPSKYNGLYEWVTQEELDDHHKLCQKPLEHYANFLSNLKLDIQYPIWEYNNAQNMGGTKLAFEIRACNLLPDIMSVPTVDKTPGCYDRATWVPIKITRRLYSGIVYSLDVEGEKTYIANNIVTHNCPVEKAVMAQWVQVTLTALNIDPKEVENAVDVSMVFELAGLEMLRYRAAWDLSKNPSLVEERIVGYSPQGEPIYGEQPKAALIVLEKYGKLVSKLRDQLLATRRAQAQVGKLSNDLSMRGAELLDKARELARKRKMQQDTVEVEFKIANEQSKPTGPTENT